jgi:hypothetical protein
MGAMSSPLRGTEGNVEFLIWAIAHEGGGIEPPEAARQALADLEDRERP